MKKYAAIAIVIIILCLFMWRVALAAPTTTYFTNIAPTVTNTYNLGTSALAWAKSFFKQASTTDLSIGGKLYDINNSSGLNGYVLQTVGTSIQWVSTSTLGISGGTSSSFAYPFPLNATSTNLSFTGGLTTSGLSIGALTGTLNSNAGTVYATATSTPTVTAPIAYSGTLGSFIGGVSGAFSCVVATGSVAGCLSAADWTTFNGKQPAGNYITALTGDVTASGPGSVAATLASVNSNVGTFTNPSVTVNAKGLVTAISNGSSSTNFWTQLGQAIYNNTGTAVGINLTNPTADLEVQGTTTNSTVFQVWSDALANIFNVQDNGTVGIGAGSPTKDLSFGGQVARTIWSERNTTTNIAGNSLRIQSGGATSGATDKNAGDMIISGGISTGAGTGAIKFFTTPTNGGVTSIVIISGGSGYTIGDVLTLATGGGNAQVTVTALGSTNVTAVSVTTPGTGYTVTPANTTNQNFAATGGTGTGFTYFITGVTGTSDGAPRQVAVFNGAGNLGIGATTSPGYVLSVAGSASFGNSITAGRRSDFDNQGRLSSYYADNSNQPVWTIYNQGITGANQGDSFRSFMSSSTVGLLIPGPKISFLSETAMAAGSANGMGFDFATSLNSNLIDTMRLTSAGNVGIGSSSPFARLSIKGVGTGTGINFQTTDSAFTPLVTGLDNGNFGIGSSTPGSLLSIGSQGTGTNLFNNATTTKDGVGGYNITQGCYAVAGVCIGGGAGAITSVSNSDGTLTISPTTGAVVASLALGHANTWTVAQQFPSGSATTPGILVGGTGQGIFAPGIGVLAFGGSSNEFGRFDSTGLSIGTTSKPSTFKEEIVSPTAQQLVLSDGTTTNTPWAFRSVNGNLYIGTSSPLTYATSSQAAVTISQATQSAIGIGTTSPWRSLSVVGTVAFPTLSAAAGTVFGVCENGATGEIEVNTLSNCTVSSKRFKHDIAPLSLDALSTLEQFKPSSFIYNGSTQTRYGFIAEDIAALDPNLAGYGKDGLVSSIDPVGIDAIIVKAVQEQQMEITNLSKGVAKSAEDSWQDILIALLMLWSLVLTGYVVLVKK